MTATNESPGFRPALVVVDMQEDFCPPNGSLAVDGGRDLAPLINKLLSFPFVIKVASRDFHPSDHISFNTCHSPPNNKPFESTATMTNPVNASEKQQTPIWPVPCVQGTPGAEIIQEIDVWSLDKVVDKGRDRRVEMFSAFSDAFGNKSDAASFDLAAVLREAAVSDVYCVGLTGDCCVKCTAIDAKKEGFAVHVIEDGTRSVDPGENGWLAAKREFELAGVKVVSSDSPEVQKIRVLR